MTFRVIDLVTKVDGNGQRAFRMCDASGEDPCDPASAGPPADCDDNTKIKDKWDGPKPSGRGEDRGKQDNDCGPRAQALPLLRAELRRTLQEPPASPW